MTTAGSLRIRDLRAGYPHKRVIDGLSIDSIGPGQLTVLVGPNGAGKSTLLRSLAGLLPAAGSVRLGDRELIGASVREHAAAVAFMPQTLPQQVGLTVFEAVVTALRASAVEGLPESSGPHLERRAMATLERVGIGALAMEPLDHLSGGERQLASLAQSVVRNPAVLLLDEPTSALDLRHQVTVMSLVRELAADGRIVVAVLHDLNLAARWADHVVVMHRGAVQVDGTPAQALTPGMLAAVYGVRARVVAETDGRVSVFVDGLVEP